MKHYVTAATFSFWSVRLTFKIHFYVKICRSQEKWFSCSLIWQKLHPSLPLAHHWQESSPDALAHPWDEAGRYHRRLGTVSRRRAGQRTDTDVLSQAWLCWTLGFLLWQLIIYFSFPWFVCLFFCWFKKINEWIVSDSLGCQKQNICSRFAYLYNKFDHLTYASVGAYQSIV